MLSQAGWGLLSELWALLLLVAAVVRVVVVVIVVVVPPLGFPTIRDTPWPHFWSSPFAGVWGVLSCQVDMGLELRRRRSVRSDVRMRAACRHRQYSARQCLTGEGYIDRADLRRGP